MGSGWTEGCCDRFHFASRPCCGWWSYPPHGIQQSKVQCYGGCLGRFQNQEQPCEDDSRIEASHSEAECKHHKRILRRWCDDCINNLYSQKVPLQLAGLADPFTLASWSSVRRALSKDSPGEEGA